MISHEHRCIFVHIPRTGGTSIENVIWPGERTEADLWMGFVSKYRNKYQTGGLQHLLPNQIREEVGEDAFASYFKFSFVRNPWDRAVSQYRLTSKREDLRAYIGMEPGAPFKRYLQLIARHEHVQWMPQHRFIFDERRGKLVDYVGRFEQLHRDAAHVLSLLGVSGDLPHAHATERLGPEAYFDREAIEMVAALYAEDIEVFGYSGDEPDIPS